MRSTFWSNRILERQSSQNRHAGLKFSPKRENSAPSMKIVLDAVYRSCAARFGEIAFLSVKVFKIVKLAWNSLQKRKTVRFQRKLYETRFSGHAQHVFAKSDFWAKSSQNRETGLKFSPKLENSALSIKKLYKTFFSGHAQHVLAKSYFWAWKFSKSSRGPGIFSKTRKQCAFNANSTKRSFQVMRSTFWPNQSFENRETGLKFSSKRKNSALCKKIVQNPRFRSCAARFGQILIFSAKVLKIVKLASNSLQSGKTVRFSWKLYNTLFSGHAQQVLAKSHFGASKFSKSLRGPEILSKTRKQCAFHENCTRRSFQVMRISSKQKNSALSKKIVQNPLFRSCAARFGQIAFLSVKVLKIVSLAWNSRQNGKTVHFPHENCTKRSFQVMRSTFWPNRIFDRQSSQNRHAGLKFFGKRENSAPSMKILHDALFRSCAFLQNRKTVRFPRKLYKTRFSGHAHHVLAKSHFWASKFSKSSPWPEILVKTGKQGTFPMKIVQRSFQVMRSTFWPNRIFERQSSQNRHAGLKFSRKRENSAPSMKILHDALFRSCAFPQNRKTVRFPRKLYKTRFSGHAQHVLAKSDFWAPKFSKSWNWPQIFAKTGKQCAFHENCTKRSFQVMRSTFWANRIFERQISQIRETGLKFSSNWIKSALFRSCAFLQNRKTVRTSERQSS